MAIDMDKENRPPPGVVVEGKGNLTPGKYTPGRMRKKTEDQYFDVGKVGRKTGVTLPDNGVRDEHGMEPMAGIFSSPIKSPERTDGRALTSSDMHMQESSVLDIDQTLHMRRTPKLPPARASTPKHTHIGSPKRGSATRPPTADKRVSPVDDEDDSLVETQSRAQQPPNRMLSFASETVLKSTESAMTFKQKKALRKSFRPDPFASPEKVDRSKVRSKGAAPALGTVNETVDTPPINDDPIMLDDDEDLPVSDANSPEPDTSGRLQPAISKQPASSSSAATQSVQQRSLSASNLNPSKKRSRSSLEDLSDASETQSQSLEPSHRPAQKKQRSRSPSDSGLAMPMDDYDEPATNPSLLGAADQDAAEPTVPQKKSKGKTKVKILQDRDTNQPVRGASNHVKLNDALPRASMAPSKGRGDRGHSIAPGENFNLRATTPFDDAIGVSRYGRTLIKPLAYWANEQRVWKDGEVQTIIRAEEVKKPRSKPKKRSKKKNTRKAQDAEDSDTESVLPDEWEDDVGVITGTVAKWDAITQAPSPDESTKEDLAFAASSIITRPVKGSDFKYAKIMNLPFFGAGLVEIPPEGHKRAKNSKNMQMCFFVHEGKVMVDIGAQGMPGSVNSFAISKGGVWVVPRGNNYTITNESKTKTAKIFFAQGCEVDGFGDL